MNIFSWEVAEYAPRERTTDWFWGLGIVALIAAGTAIYFKDYLFAILIGLSAITIGLFTRRTPRTISYELSRDGISIDKLLYPWNTLQSFWVEQRGHRPKIIIISKKFFVPHIIIPIEGAEPSDVRAFLLEKLPEVESHEPFAHIISERLGL